jgi:maltose/moltooligosaccharide transporter
MHKSLWMICVTHMFIEVQLLMPVALIPVFIQEFQLGLLEASLVATIPSLFGLISYIPSGYLSDRFKPSHLLSASLIISGLSAIFVSQTSNFWTLVLGIALARVSSPIYHVSGLSQMTKLVEGVQTSRSMGFHNALGNFGTAIGVISLAIFLSTLGWRWAYLFWSVPILVWGFLMSQSIQPTTAVFRKSRTTRDGTIRRLFGLFSAGFLVFLVTISFREIGAVGVSTYMTTYFVKIRGLSESTSSLVFGLGPFMGMIGSLGGGYLGERMGARKALSLAIAGCVILLSLLAFSSQIHLLALIYMIYSFFGYGVYVNMNTIVAEVTPATERIMGFSVYFFTEALLASLTPTLAATIIEPFGILYIFPFGIILLIASVIALNARRT